MVGKDTSTIKIKGYDCYKIRIDEVRSIFGEEMITHYEIYATKAIQLDVGLILDWKEKVIEDCPVVIRWWVNDDLANYNVLRLSNFSNDVTEDLFDLPEKFRR